MSDRTDPQGQNEKTISVDATTPQRDNSATNQGDGNNNVERAERESDPAASTLTDG